MTRANHESAIEALLFACGAPVPLETIAGNMELDCETAKELVQGLAAKYAAEQRGILILEFDGAYQMRTNPEFYEFVCKTAQNVAKRPLSQAALETLAIVAYKQPVTKAEIEQIRGVDSVHAVNKLVEAGLIMENGRRNVPGKPLVFITTDSFLSNFGLKSLNELPALNNDMEQLKREAEEEVSRLK